MCFFFKDFTVAIFAFLTEEFRVDRKRIGREREGTRVRNGLWAGIRTRDTQSEMAHCRRTDLKAIVPTLGSSSRLIVSYATVLIMKINTFTFIINLK